MANRELYLTEKIKNIAYNAKYKAISFFQQYNKERLIQPGEELFLLGNYFEATEENVEEINKTICSIFENTIWITYRSGFPQLPNQIVGSYVSDTGWGCMVRVGQMLFAQIIKHHQGINSKEGLLNILSLFNDVDKKEPFSIQNIARLARIQYGLKPGDWYNPSQISFILSQLHERYLAEEMKLKFTFFNSGNLFYDTIAQSMIGKDPSCKCQKQPDIFLCQKCHKKQNSVAVIILIRIGLNGPEERYLTILQKIMQIPYFQGLLGGKPEKALYFVGKHKKHYIYLDPHYVQGAEQNVKEKSESYFCGSFRKCKNTSIDSSIGISFYLSGIKELNGLHRELNKIKEENCEDFFIFMADKTPSYAKASKQSINKEFEEEIFEVL